MGNDKTRAARYLRDHGYVMLDVLPPDELVAYNRRVLEYLDTLPERVPGSDGLSVSGGFACYGVASSFHNPVVRELRLRLDAVVRPVLRSLCGGERNIQSVVDRVMDRARGLCAGTESVHRDEAKGALKDDWIFGGALNLNLEGQQAFSLQPDTHIFGANVAGGNFTVETDRDIKREFKARRQLVEFGPGQMILLFENIRHEVRGNKATCRQLRLFHGFRVTDSFEALYPENVARMATQDILVYKGGELPRMIPKLYPNLHWGPWQTFSGKNKWHPLLLNDHTVGSGVHKGKRLSNVVRPFAPSLRELGAMYEPYSPEELALFVPSR